MGVRAKSRDPLTIVWRLKKKPVIHIGVRRPGKNSSRTQGTLGELEAAVSSLAST